MKKWLSVVVMAALIFVWAAPGFADAAPAKTVMYFWGNGCPHCKEAAPIIDRMIANGVTVEKYEVYDNTQNSDQLVMFFKMHGVPEADWGVPVAFYNGKMFLGLPRIAELENELAE